MREGRNPATSVGAAPSRVRGQPLSAKPPADLLTAPCLPRHARGSASRFNVRLRGALKHIVAVGIAKITCWSGRDTAPVRCTSPALSEKYPRRRGARIFAIPPDFGQRSRSRVPASRSQGNLGDWATSSAPVDAGPIRYGGVAVEPRLELLIDVRRGTRRLAGRTLGGEGSAIREAGAPSCSGRLTPRTQPDESQAAQRESIKAPTPSPFAGEAPRD